MTSFSIPTLRREGVITDPAKGLNYIMSCFFFSKYSQTALYRGNVISLSNIIKHSGDNPLTISSNLELKLVELLSRYFQTADVEATANQGEGPDIHVNLKVTVVPNGGSTKDAIDLGYALTISDNTFKKIVSKLNNETLF